MTASLCHLLPVVLALLAVCARGKGDATGVTGGRWFFPAAVEPYPYPIVGVGCEGGGGGDCAFGVSPRQVRFV